MRTICPDHYLAFLAKMDVWCPDVDLAFGGSNRGPVGHYHSHYDKALQAYRDALNILPKVILDGKTTAKTP